MVGKYVYAVRVGNREWQALLAAAPGPGLHASQRVRLARPARTVMVMLMPVKGLFLAATIICYGVYFLDKVKEEDRDQTEIHSFLIIVRNVVFIVSVMEIKEKWRGIGWSVGSRPNQQVLVSLQ